MSTQQRQRRDKRTPTPPRMRLMERDKAILRAVGEYRILRQDQLQALFFGSKSTAQYRLSHLYQHGFLARYFLPVEAGWSPTLYTLDKRGLELLRGEYGIDAIQTKVWDGENGPEFLAHTLAINDVRLTVTLACQKAGYTHPLWLSDADMKANYDRVEIRSPKGIPSLISLIPDSYFVIQTPQGKAHFFLELDRGTMPTTRFAAKILAYQVYVASGQYQRRYQTRSLRMLTVTLSKKRLENLKKVTESVRGGRLFWFAVLNDLTPETVFTSGCWHIAGSQPTATLLPAGNVPIP